MNRRDVLALASRFGVVAAVAPLARTTPLLARAQDAWGKDALTRHSVRPPDYETPIALLDSFITPIERFYVRCHLPVPGSLDASSWSLRIMICSYLTIGPVGVRVRTSGPCAPSSTALEMK